MPACACPAFDLHSRGALLRFEGQIRLEVEHAHYILEHRDRSDRCNVLVKELVRIPHLACDERIDADDLRTRRTHGERTRTLSWCRVECEHDRKTAVACDACQSAS